MYKLPKTFVPCESENKMVERQDIVHRSRYVETVKGRIEQI